MKDEIEAQKISRRVLSRRSSQVHPAPKSRKLASAQRLCSDALEFLVEYLHGGKKLSRNSAKHAYRNFHTAITDVRTSGLVVNLSEQEFDFAWGTLPFSSWVQPCGLTGRLIEALPRVRLRSPSHSPC